MDKAYIPQQWPIKHNISVLIKCFHQEVTVFYFVFDIVSAFFLLKSNKETFVVEKYLHKQLNLSKLYLHLKHIFQ